MAKLRSRLAVGGRVDRRRSSLLSLNACWLAIASEKRPLIWLAKFYLDRGNLAKSEELARQAIAIDPSDGEQGRGDRMRAYAVLAEILTKRGDTKTAATYRGPSRQSAWRNRPINSNKPECSVAGSGCIERVSPLSRTPIASSRGSPCNSLRQGTWQRRRSTTSVRLNSCPKVLGESKATASVAKVYLEARSRKKLPSRYSVKTRIAAQPNNPQVHYLLGYRKVGIAKRRRLKSFREAVRLDPDYLNAWQKLLTFDDTELTTEDRDQATFQVLRLDPLQASTSPPTSP